MGASAELHSWQTSTLAASAAGQEPTTPQNHGIMESLRLERTFKISLRAVAQNFCGNKIDGVEMAIILKPALGTKTKGSKQPGCSIILTL